MPLTDARAALTAVLLAALLLAGGCARAGSQPATPAPRQTPAPATAEKPAALAQLNLGLEATWRGFTQPVYLTNAGDGSGRLFVVEQVGTVKVIEAGKVTAAPYLDVRKLVTTGGERGLLGLAFSPQYARDGRIFVDYTDRNGDTVIARYTTREPASSAPALEAPRVLMTIKQPYANHNGGCLQFGPDGRLYIGMGDGGSGGDPQGRAQNPRSLLGKMLRIDVSHESSSAAWTAPPDNPFARGAGTRPEIWAMGLRNPWRFSFDASGGALWIGDVGQDGWEEINRVDAASLAQTSGVALNFGWNVLEGTRRYPRGPSATYRKGPVVAPIFEHPHPQGESVTGGYVYRGKDYPALVGTYVYADFVKGWIGGIRLESPSGDPLAKPEQRVLMQTSGQPSSFGVDESGELYLVDYQGIIWSVIASAK